MVTPCMIERQFQKITSRRSSIADFRPFCALSRKTTTANQFPLVELVENQLFNFFDQKYRFLPATTIGSEWLLDMRWTFLSILYMLANSHFDMKLLDKKHPSHRYPWVNGSKSVS